MGPREKNSIDIIKNCRISGSHSGGYEEFYLAGYNAI
jgi:hypothetical protein